MPLNPAVVKKVEGWRKAGLPVYSAAEAAQVAARVPPDYAGPFETVHRRAGAHALVKDCGLAPLDIIAAHEADDGRIPAQLLPDHGQLTRVAEMEGVIFTDHADRLHKRPSDKKILGNSCFPFAFVV